MKIEKRYITIAIRWIVAVMAVAFIVRQIQLKDRSHDIFDDMALLTTWAALPLLIGQLIGMLINWGLEAYKWEVLIKGRENVPFIRSLKAIFSGLTIAVCTPNRMGEYAGRVFHLQKADHIDGVLLTLVGSYAQLLVTIIAGLLASIFYLPKFVGFGPLHPYRFWLTGVLVVALCIFLVILYLNSRLLTTVIEHLPLSKKLKKYGEVFSLHTKPELFRVLLASAGRYVIFSAQFLALLWFFKVQIDVANGLIMIALSYFVMSIIPTIAITELGIRGAVSIYFFGQLSPNVEGIISASSMLWLINLVLPALLGVLFIFEMKFFRK